MNEQLMTQGQQFSLAAAGPIDPDMQALLADMAEDLDPDSRFTFTRIKPPSGDSAAFTIRSDDPNTPAQVFATFDAVVVHEQRINVLWGKTSDPDNNAPVCSSKDAKVGIRQDGTTCNCKTCPYNQYGTGTDDQGRATKGKACKNAMNLYLRLENREETCIMQISPTSLKEVNTKTQKVLSMNRPYNSVIFRFSSKTESKAGGKVYSTLIMNPVEALPPDVARQMYFLREEIKSTLTASPVTAIREEEYNLVPGPATSAPLAQPTIYAAPTPAPQTQQARPPFQPASQQQEPAAQPYGAATPSFNAGGTRTYPQPQNAAQATYGAVTATPQPRQSAGPVFVEAPPISQSGPFTTLPGDDPDLPF